MRSRAVSFPRARAPRFVPEITCSDSVLCPEGIDTASWPRSFVLNRDITEHRRVRFAVESNLTMISRIRNHTAI